MTDPYAHVLEYLLSDIGINFTDSQANVALLSKHLGVGYKQTRAVLQTMNRRGLLKFNRREGMWTVVGASEAA